jgi:hypothetical protein
MSYVLHLLVTAKSDYARLPERATRAALRDEEGVAMRKASLVTDQTLQDFKRVFETLLVARR